MSVKSNQITPLIIVRFWGSDNFTINLKQKHQWKSDLPSNIWFYVHSLLLCEEDFPSVFDVVCDLESSPTVLLK